MKNVFKKLLRWRNFRITTYASVNFDYRIFLKIAYLRDFFEMIKEIPGDIVELGFGYGHTALIISSFSETDSMSRNLYFFDSFRGFPDPKKFDFSARNPLRGDWSHRSMKEAKEQFRQYFISQKTKNSINFIEGFVEKSLLEFIPSNIALLHIDLDLYEGHKIALEKLYSSVSPGGVIIFDDYKQPNWPGATQAVDEFFKDKMDLIRLHANGKYFVIKPAR